MRPHLVLLAACVILLSDGLIAQEGPDVFAGKPVQFQDLSAGLPTEWFWDFDFVAGLPPTFDSTDRNPVVTFVEARPHDVLLRACNNAGCTEVFKTVNVVPLPTEIFADGFESGDLNAWSEVSP